MKSLQASRIFFYGFVFGLFLCVDFSALSSHSAMYDFYRSQATIKKLSDDVSSIENEDVKDCVDKILLILVDTYEKIVGATVLYYLMMHDPCAQKDIHSEIAKIMHDATLKILTILKKELLFFVFDKKISLQKKCKACLVIVSIILLMKLGINNFCIISNQEKNKEGLDVDMSQESIYLSDKFSNYR